MTLQRQSTLLAWLAVLALLLVVGVTMSAANDVRTQTDQIEMAESTAKAVGNFRYLIMETALYREARSGQQWRQRVDSFRRQLAAHRYNEGRQQALLDRERGNLAVIERLFDSLTGAADSARTASVVSALFLTTEQMASDAFELMRMNRDDLQRAQAQYNRVVLFALALLACLIGSAYLILRRRVLAPVARISMVVEQVAQGDLTPRVALRLDNEIGFLAHRFDVMTEQLAQTHGAISIEVQERRRAESALQESVTELAMARDLAQAANIAKSQFLANMGHELRTPMNGILGMLQLLRYTRLTEQQQDYVEKSSMEAQSLLALLSDLLDFSRMEMHELAIEATPFEIETVLTDLAIRLRALQGGKALEVVIRCDPGVPATLVGDGARLRQIMLILAGNGLKFTEHGEVVVDVSCLHADGKTAELEFSVRDTGIGIAAEQLDAIFEQFRQSEGDATRRYGGAGLGLSISRRLVGLMGGELEVSSEAGVGSVFRFRLRLAMVELAAIKSETAPYRVLVVDDHALAREAILGMVEVAGWRGETAAGAAQALTRLEGQDGGFDVVLLDWRMPEMDGWQLAARLRAARRERRRPVIIMVTGCGSIELAARSDAERALIDGYLSKPVTLSLLREAVSAAFEVERSAGVTDHARLAGLRVLVVDDNPMNLQVACELLQREGAHAESAEGGLAAIALARRGDRAYDAVLMDIQMPDMDGLETTRRLRADPQTAALPIIALTSNVLESDRAASLAAGMDAHLDKPVALEELVRTLLGVCKARPLESAPVGDVADGAPSSPSPVIDSELALSRLGGNVRLYATLIQSFHKECSSALKALHLAQRHDMLGAGADRLHAFKSAAAMIGAVSLQECAAELETCWRNGVGGDGTSLAALTQLTERCLSELDQFAGEEAPT
jgi:signal transduction histidine kinase/DNA-binding response OmpR family regulator/HPt (histidine-containing phosphotransfer) domain-containing protein